jgi:hypothetical protein
LSYYPPATPTPTPTPTPTAVPIPTINLYAALYINSGGTIYGCTSSDCSPAIQGSATSDVGRLPSSSTNLGFIYWDDTQYIYYDFANANMGTREWITYTSTDLTTWTQTSSTTGPTATNHSSHTLLWTTPLIVQGSSSNGAIHLGSGSSVSIGSLPNDPINNTNTQSYFLSNTTMYPYASASIYYNNSDSTYVLYYTSDGHNWYQYKATLTNPTTMPSLDFTSTSPNSFSQASVPVDAGLLVAQVNTPKAQPTSAAPFKALYVSPAGLIFGCQETTSGCSPNSRGSSMNTSVGSLSNADYHGENLQFIYWDGYQYLFYDFQILMSQPTWLKYSAPDLVSWVYVNNSAPNHSDTLLWTKPIHYDSNWGIPLKLYLGDYGHGVNTVGDWPADPNNGSPMGASTLYTIMDVYLSGNSVSAAAISIYYEKSNSKYVIHYTADQNSWYNYSSSFDLTSGNTLSLTWTLDGQSSSAPADSGLLLFSVP